MNAGRGERSIAFEFRPLLDLEKEWCPDLDSNQGHCDFQSHALPTELSGRRGSARPRSCWWARYSRWRPGCPVALTALQRSCGVPGVCLPKPSRCAGCGRHSAAPRDAMTAPDEVARGIRAMAQDESLAMPRFARPRLGKHRQAPARRIARGHPAPCGSRRKKPCQRAVKRTFAETGGIVRSMACQSAHQSGIEHLNGDVAERLKALVC